jgi:RNA polymerase sigma-70 factor (ECF subfamily)
LSLDVKGTTSGLSSLVAGRHQPFPGHPVLLEDGNDAELVARCLQGDPEAFEPVVARYQRVLFNVAYRMVNDREDARDIAQTAFVKAYEKLHTYDPRYRFFSWIYRIAVNECLNFLERRRAQQPLGADLVDPAAPHDEVQARELSERVQSALMKLSPDYRQVLVLRHFVELSYDEMSGLLAIPVKTVKSRLYTARQRMGEMLEGSVAR